MKKIVVVAACAFLIAPTLVMASAGGGKQRYGDEDITELYQLCEQLGIEDGFVAVESCTGDNSLSCVTTKVDCSQSPETDD